ncbi:GNAT family N-acetyltransferase [Lysinibacillus irui]|uniref:GNAT family N-acetyltransferase n=1 Tax=Lysinibacillus irui TaxID=2998077 RepID=A0ABU5NRB4_9BACI|nr:GNAT family N-acetyltransferase [Lysinibacillus irui]MEA0552621.1 GNAT family N-acetyltransferase [Lysinibacillus irui]MEA0978573.1 GNAT family N-acetyltransferase [Lysinibacillus irui]MEA1044727.1 GNAT family N-acetyltransferase [Lysinibacillus irui]
MLEKVRIHKVVTPIEIAEVQKLNAEIWGSQAIPSHQLLAAVQNGGLVLGAYLDEKLIGFNYCFVGYRDREMYLHSHMIGVEKAYREQGVGELLKHAQQEYAKENGFQLVRWLIDPLEAGLANLAFLKLNATSFQYENDYYGPLQDDFNEGLPSDRLVVEWWIEREQVTDSLDELEEIAQEIVPWTLTVDGLPVLDIENEFQMEQSFYNDAYLLAIPQSLQKMKVESPKLAEDWRYKIRTILTTLFNQDYAIVRVKKHKEYVHSYLLVRRSLLAL